MEIILGLLISLGIIGGVSVFADRKVSYIVDRTNLRDWVKKYYNQNIENLPPCSICGKDTNKDSIGKLFTYMGKIYVVCKKRGCSMRTKGEIISNGYRNLAQPAK